MEYGNANSFTLHSAFNSSLKTLKASLKRIPFDNAPIILSGFDVIGGFGSYYHSLREGVDVPVYRNVALKDNYEVAVYLLNALVCECYLLDGEYKHFSNVCSKVKEGLKKKPVMNDLKLNSTNVCSQNLHELVKNGTIEYRLAVLIAEQIGENKQREMLRRISRAKLDYDYALKIFVNEGKNGLNNVLEEKNVMPVRAEGEIAEGVVISGRYLDIEKRIGELDHLVINAALEKAKLIQEIHREKIYLECGCETFREYYETRLNMKKTHVYRLLKMCSYSPVLLTKMPYKKLTYIHEWATKESVGILDKELQLITPAGNTVTLDDFINSNIPEMKRLLLPFMREKYQERFKKELSGEINYMDKLKSLVKQMNKLFLKIKREQVNDIMASLGRS